MARPRQATAQLEAKGAFDKNPQRKRTGEPVPPKGAPIKPKFLKGRSARIWDEYAPICVAMKTLARGDELEFGTWCRLQAEYERDPEKFATSRIAQKRAYAEKFGLAGAGARAKLASGKGDKPADPAAKYFELGSGNTVCQ